jgi:hypothetical protein
MVHHPPDSSSPQNSTPNLQSPDLEKSAKPLAASVPGPPPDGGLQAWLAVAGGFCIVFASFGWINCPYPKHPSYLQVIVKAELTVQHRHWHFPRILRVSSITKLLVRHRSMDPIDRDIHDVFLRKSQNPFLNQINLSQFPIHPDANCLIHRAQ